MNIWLDTADPKDIWDRPDIEGITTNPKLYRDRYQDHPALEQWRDSMVAAANGRPISFEVTGWESLAVWRAQAERILAWRNVADVYVKIPIQTPDGDSTASLIADLECVNATCVFTLDQARAAIEAGAAIVSVFAGRIADTGRDPAVMMAHLARTKGASRLLWGSARQVRDVSVAQSVGADIITLPPDLWDRQPRLGMDLEAAALETVREFCA